MIEAIPLDRAVICLNCPMITASTNDCCSYCGCKGVVSLAKWLNRTEEYEEDVVTATPNIGA